MAFCMPQMEMRRTYTYEGMRRKSVVHASIQWNNVRDFVYQNKERGSEMGRFMAKEGAFKKWQKIAEHNKSIWTWLAFNCVKIHNAVMRLHHSAIAYDRARSTPNHVSPALSAHVYGSHDQLHCALRWCAFRCKISNSNVWHILAQ